MHSTPAHVEKTKNKDEVRLDIDIRGGGGELHTLTLHR